MAERTPARPRTSALRKDRLRESEKKRRDRARSRKYRLQQIMIGAEADRWKELKARVGEGREPCVVVPIRSTWHPRAFVYISRFNSSSHVIITPSATSVESKWRSLMRVVSRLLSFLLLVGYQEAFHCCLVVTCINRINMISTQCHRVGQWWAGKPEFENLIDSGQGKSCVYSL